MVLQAKQLFIQNVRQLKLVDPMNNYLGKFIQRSRNIWNVIVHDAKISQKRTDIPSITPEEIAEVRDFFPMEKFFIFGHSRSGNTLLMRLIRLHPEVHANYQGTFFSRPPGLKSLVNSPEIEAWLSRGTNYWNHGRDLSPLVMRAAADFIMERDARKYGKRIVGDKSPTTITSGQAIRDAHKIYPDARIIYIIRDGRDVMVSDRFRNFVEEKFLRAGDAEIIAAFQKNPDQFKSGERSLFTEAWLRDPYQGIPSWSINLVESRKEGQRLYGEKYYEIKYEDILTDPLNELKKLWTFLGVRNNKVSPALKISVKNEIAINPDETWQAERNSAIAPYLSKGRYGNWKTFFTQEDKRVFKELAGEQLITWGYERDF